MSRRRRARVGVVLVVTMMATIAGSGCGDEGSAVGAGEGKDPLSTLSEALDSAGGPVVAETDIVFVEGSDTVRVGGLDITLPLLTSYYEPGGRNITVPPSWPVLNDTEIWEHDAELMATIGLAVFKQTTLVTEDDSRERLVSDGFGVANHQDSEVVHQSVVTNPESGVTCWTEVRFGRTREFFDPSYQSVVLFAGPGIASSGMIV